MRKRETLKQIVSSLPKLKQLDDSRLPGYFDTMWDIKYKDQLIGYLIYHNNPDVYSALARYGYDVKEIKKLIEMERLKK